MSSLFPLPSPTLPDFTSLLVSGPIHPSASVHLCLTHLASRPGSNAIFLTPSRDTFLSALNDFNDDWLNECGGYGAVVSVLSRVISLYPPSPAHLALLLSMIKIVESTDDPAYSARIPLDEPPELIVLHELSSYFMDSDGSTHGDLPSYISLIASALSAASTFDPPVPLVLIDSRLETLQLPLIRSFSSDSVNSDANRPRPVTSVIEHFFEWKGVINVTAKAEDDAPDGRIGKSLSLRKLRGAPANEDEGGTVWEWEEADGEVRGSAGRAGRVFVWP